MDTDNSDRRAFLIRLGSVAALLSGGLSARAFGQSAGSYLQDLAGNLDRPTSALRETSLSEQAWRDAINEVLAEIDLDDLLAAMDFEALASRTGYAERGVATAPVRMMDDQRRRLSFHPKMFAVGQGRAIVPHGHDNMVSAHLTLSGQFHVRQYDKLAVEPDALLIRPSIDMTAGPGQLSSISGTADNIHWFVAEQAAHTLDIVVLGLDPQTRPGFDIYNLDIRAAESLEDGVLRAPRISVPDALRLYG